MIARLLRRTWRLAGFVGFYARNLGAANLLVAREVLTGRPGIRPAIVRHRLQVDSEIAIVSVANLISLTPGTLTLDFDDEESAVYVHAMYAGSIEELRADLVELERRLLRVLR